MINRLKQIKFTKKGLYISLAICMLLIGCIGIYSSIKNMNKIVEETDFEYESISSPLELAAPEPLSALKNNEESTPTINEEPPVVLNFIQPVEGEVSKQFSGKDLVYSETMNDYRTHNGVDIITSDGAPVYSSEAGIITDVQKDPLWGNCVTVEHDNNFSTCYKNMSDILPEGVEVGSYIAQGGVIGSAGSSALVEIGEQTHLHFEMYVNGEPIDPEEYFN